MTGRAHFNLSGQRALVTGGGRGIGAAIVTRFAEAGAEVIAANRTLAHAEALAATLGARGLKVEPVAFDNLSRPGLKALIDGAAADGGLDILVHNAGGCLGRPSRRSTRGSSRRHSGSILAPASG